MPFFRKKNSQSKVVGRKREVPGGLWKKCPSCAEMLYMPELEQMAQVCQNCGYHFQLPRMERVGLLLEEGSWDEWDSELYSVDTLDFTGAATYKSKLSDNIKKTGFKDAISCGQGMMGPHKVGLGVMDFSFLGASMGSVVGEKVTRLFERCTNLGLPVVLSAASGGARMYEGLFSLMQMAKTSGAIARHAEASLPYISLLTHPTTAGVMASFASLGDIIIAEPQALIGFAGPRVIKETTQQNLPEGFQRSEFLLKHGLLDKVIKRSEVKSTIISYLNYTMPQLPAQEHVEQAES